MKRKNKGFTLIELLAVIVILGLLMAIAIPSVTKYITESRKKTLATTIGNYMTALTSEVNNKEYIFTATNTIYAVPIECIALERGGTDPFGEWMQASSSYWSYVLVQYDDISSSYTYGFTFKDSAGYGLYPTTAEKLKESGKQINTDLDELKKPDTRQALDYLDQDKWDGFNVNSSTRLIVLESASEGETGDGKNTCTLCIKSDNYDLAEQEKKDKWKIGKEICFDSNECFNIIDSNSNTVTMLAREKIELTITNPKQNISAGASRFSNTQYWLENSNIKAQYGTEYPIFAYDSNSPMYSFVEAYEDYLQEDLGITSASASLISFEQFGKTLKCAGGYRCQESPYKNWLVKDYFWWTGSVTYEGARYLHTQGFVGHVTHTYGCAIRPIITVDKSQLFN